MRALHNACTLVAAATLTSTLLASLAFGAPSAESSPKHANATVSVDFSASKGARVRAERFNNFSGAPNFAKQRPEDVRFFNAQGLHGQIYRVWIRAQNIFDPATGKYNYECRSGKILNRSNHL